MISRKRTAEDSLLPTRASKVPRTARIYYDEDPSPSQREGIRARWQRVFSEVYELGCETLEYIFNGAVPGKSKLRSECGRAVVYLRVCLSATIGFFTSITPNASFLFRRHFPCTTNSTPASKTTTSSSSQTKYNDGTTSA